ncbi:lipocalin-like domain-containing protein [Geoalkalibacter halelectricus]|uniref:Carotenoid 1,2-hydratase n=1 Tax=Geoalkalibacter halelectricus TaxID=2847045 RepID=A0ABY5ZRU9_9BACT|nr:lipocalin-like domain-containing protein [Geoalkalibacter halelectricus]MDO3377580.1 carotenoid 1,2-hydratase [Geoalkalibacter halelectricus]UWZ80662.1 carotenoid 1,2-hydratase [Geoalkalibacter halelectricus]
MPWITLLLALLLSACGPTPDSSSATEGGLSLAETLGAEEDPGYARATAPRPFVFPDDHGPHPEFKTEWWYFTGNLSAADGRRFGYQLTFFRVALSPQAPQRPSPWGTNQVYMAHFALSDIDGRRFFAVERFSRAALGLTGAQAAPFRVWLEDWQASGPAHTFPMHLRAAAQEVSIDLRVEQGKPLVLQGDAGLSQKSAAAGNASYYYSFTRLPTSGQVHLGGQTFSVTGDSWLDREWSTSALAPDQVGWDWFALQLDGEEELMYYQLRRQDGGSDPASKGIWVAPDGEGRLLRRDDVELEVLATWRSPRGGTYPAQWLLRVPRKELELRVTPLLADQELDVSIRYWEGAVEVSGTRAGRPVTGRGYVELTGYAEDPPGAKVRH